MASIGGYTATIFNGPVQPSGVQTEQIIRPGVDGVDIRVLGLRGEPYQLRCVFQSSSESLMLALKVDLLDLQGSLVTVVDSFGNTYYYQHVQRVTIQNEQYMPIVSSGGNYVLTALFELMDTNI